MIVTRPTPQAYRRECPVSSLDPGVIVLAPMTLEEAAQVSLLITVALDARTARGDHWPLARQRHQRGGRN
jgi:hypothetical protein